MKKIIALLLLSTVGLTGCLKTRAQLRADGSNDDSAIPAGTPTEPGKPAAAPQDVTPSGGGYALDELKSEITRIEGRLEDIERAQKGSAGDSSSKEDLKKLEARVTELEQSQVAMIETIKKLQEAPPAVDTKELLEKAHKQFDAKDYKSSVETLTAYLAQGKAAKDSEQATYLRAESYYKLKEYKKAIVDYSIFPDKYSKSKLMPTVLYRIGLCFDALEMKSDARTFYEQIVDNFPKSPEAKKAHAKIK